MKQAAKDLWEVTQDYQALADLMPSDEPCSRFLAPINEKLLQITIQFLKHTKAYHDET